MPGFVKFDLVAPWDADATLFEAGARPGGASAGERGRARRGLYFGPLQGPAQGLAQQLQEGPFRGDSHEKTCRDDSHEKCPTSLFTSLLETPLRVRGKNPRQRPPAKTGKRLARGNPLQKAVKGALALKRGRPVQGVAPRPALYSLASGPSTRRFAGDRGPLRGLRKRWEGLCGPISCKGAWSTRCPPRTAREGVRGRRNEDASGLAKTLQSLQGALQGPGPEARPPAC
mmetsp:Transcript_27896/g.99247  ORF Transcript_27896/g.99247 Transcript_27896/m.99247 type:complete len:229 (+) Transcript_27896:773-1459(+)